jgi:hypothetical protein
MVVSSKFRKNISGIYFCLNLKNLEHNPEKKNNNKFLIRKIIQKNLEIFQITVNKI